MSAVAIIPARMGSTRFPGKALACETGTPLVVHVCHRAGSAPSISRVVVATDDAAIADAVRAHGYEAVMTGEHPNGTSRIAEAVERLHLGRAETVVNVQGDEPEIEPGVIDGAVIALRTSTVLDLARFGSGSGDGPLQWVGTVATPIDDASDPNVVKVALGLIEPESGVAPALYFSRAAIPHAREDATPPRRFRHVGIYAYRVSALRRYTDMPPTPSERAERLEQLRWLEHGYSIAAAIRDSDHAGIDTPSQYEAFVARHARG